MNRQLLIPLALAALVATPALAQNGARQAEAIAKADTNGDGMVSRDEIATMKVGAFSRLDGNGDGYISQAEADKMRRMFERSMNGAGFADADTNGDGNLSQSEFTTYSPLFNSADTNGDNLLSQAEITAMRQALQN